MLERVDFFIRDISAIPVADTGRIWSRCLNEINYLKNRKNFLVREGYEAERRSRSDEALYAITTIRRSLSHYRMAVRAALGESHPALRYLKPSIDDQAAVKEAQPTRLNDARGLYVSSSGRAPCVRPGRSRSSPGTIALKLFSKSARFVEISSADVEMRREGGSISSGFAYSGGELWTASRLPARLFARCCAPPRSAGGPPRAHSPS
jgi:hypothetical protein